MTVADQSEGVLKDIAAHPPLEALAVIRARGEPGALLLSAADDAEKLIFTDLKRALDAVDALVAVADLLGAPLPRARARRARAQALAYANRFDEALADLSTGVVLADAAGDALEAARARMTTLHALARLGRHAEAIQAGEAAHRAFVEAGEPLLAARADINLGVVRRMGDDPEGAIAHFERALPALADQPMLLAQMQSNRAEALLDLNRFQEAEAAFTESLGAFRRAGAARAEAIVEGNLADLTGRQGRLDAALEHFERARRQFGQADAPGDVARLRAEQADALAALGLFEDAADQFREALPVLATHKLAWEHARATAGLGASLARLGAPAEAANALRAAAGEFDTLKHATGAARARVLLADLERQAGNLEAARAHLAAALPALADRPALAAMARLSLASVLLASARLDEARAEIDAGLEEAKRLGLAPLVADFLDLRAQARPHEPGAALRDLREAVAQVERVRGTLRAERIRASFLGDRASLYERCATALLDEGGDGAIAEAFEVAERAKSRSLLDALQAGPSSHDQAQDADGAERSLLSRMARLRAEMNALYASLDDGLSRPRAEHDTRRWTREVNRREREMIEVERSLAATARYSPVFSRPLTLADTRASLAPDEVMLHFFGEGGHLSAFVLSPRAVAVHRRFVPIGLVEELTRKLYFQIGRAIARGLPSGAAGERLGADCRRDLEALYDALLVPLEAEFAAAARLVVVPHAVLHSVPVQALTRAGAPLLDRFECVLTPSASIWSQLIRRPRSARAGQSLVVGVSDELAPEAEHEARNLASREGAVLLAGQSATVAAFRDAAAHSGAIHFAGHARFSPADPLNSGLRLADGWLTAREISGLRLAGSTVVLSGCDTGRSEISAADEIWGLVRSFLVAGASTLVISLWPAHDLTTAETMAALHANWYADDRRTGSGIAHGMQDAQRQAWRRGMHPAAWANFVVIGTP